MNADLLCRLHEMEAIAYNCTVLSAPCLHACLLHDKGCYWDRKTGELV